MEDKLFKSLNDQEQSVLFPWGKEDTAAPGLTSRLQKIQAAEKHGILKTKSK